MNLIQIANRIIELDNSVNMFIEIKQLLLIFGEFSNFFNNEVNIDNFKFNCIEKILEIIKIQLLKSVHLFNLLQSKSDEIQLLQNQQIDLHNLSDSINRIKEKFIKLELPLQYNQLEQQIDTQNNTIHGYLYIFKAIFSILTFLDNLIKKIDLNNGYLNLLLKQQTLFVKYFLEKDIQTINLIELNKNNYDKFNTEIKKSKDQFSSLRTLFINFFIQLKQNNNEKEIKNIIETMAKKMVKFNVIQTQIKEMQNTSSHFLDNYANINTQIKQNSNDINNPNYALLQQIKKLYQTMNKKSFDLILQFPYFSHNIQKSILQVLDKQNQIIQKFIEQFPPINNQETLNTYKIERKKLEKEFFTTMEEFDNNYNNNI